jgi:hypothetical protein
MDEHTLYERIWEIVRRQPAIDTHVHMSAVQPQVGDLAAALAYGNYMIELVGAGAPGEIAEYRRAANAPPPEQQVRAIYEAMKLSPHSTHAWMTRKMLEVCFGIEGEPSLNQLLARVGPPLKGEEALVRQRTVCRELAGVEKIIAVVPQGSKPGDYDSELFVPMSGFRLPGQIKRASLALFEERTRQSIADAAGLRRASIEALCDEKAHGRVAVRLDLGGDSCFCHPEASQAASAFDRAASGKEPQADDPEVLTHFLTEALVEAAAEAGLAVQVFLRGDKASGINLPFHCPLFTASLCKLAAACPSARFEIFCHSEPMQQEICLAAKHLPNLHLSAAWWYCQFPEIMERTYRLRLDMLPASKWCALFTDAYVAEWTVPKSLLHRRELTRALAAKVQAGYLKEDAVPEIARVVLYDTPRRIYGLV